MAESKAKVEVKAEAPSGGKGNKLLIIVIVVLLLLFLAAAGAAAFLLLGQKAAPASANSAAGSAKVESTKSEASDESHGSEEASEEEPKKKKKKKKEAGAPPIFEKMDTFTVNLKESAAPGPSMLQMDLSVELADVTQKDTLNNYRPKIRNNLIVFLSSHSWDEISTVEGKEKLLEEIKSRINKSMDMEDDEGIESVQITSFIMQ